VCVCVYNDVWFSLGHFGRSIKAYVFSEKNKISSLKIIWNSYVTDLLVSLKLVFLHKSTAYPVE
jgi:hypothetical protein